MAKIILYYTFFEESAVGSYEGSPQYFNLQGDVFGQVIEDYLEFGSHRKITWI